MARNTSNPDPIETDTKVQNETWRALEALDAIHRKYEEKKIDRAELDSEVNWAGKKLKGLSLIIADQALHSGHFALGIRMKTLEQK